MSLDDLLAGDAVFVDANIFTYHFQPHPTWGPSCTRFLDRIENRELDGFTIIPVVGEVAHRLMTIEAHRTLGWSFAGIGNRLRSNPAAVQKLTVFRLAAEKILQGHMQVLPVTPGNLATAVVLCQQLGLLTNDGLILATMQAHGLTKLASHDADFDRVPGITRFAPATLDFDGDRFRRLAGRVGQRAGVGGVDVIERGGGAGPVRGLLGGKASPGAFLG